MTLLLTLAAFCSTCIQFYVLLSWGWICIGFVCPELRPICKINVSLLQSIFETGRKQFLVLHWSTCPVTHAYKVTKGSIFINSWEKSASIFENSTSAYVSMWVRQIFIYSKLSLHSMRHSQEIPSKDQKANWSAAHLTAFSLELQKILSMRIISGKKHGSHMWAQMP